METPSLSYRHPILHTDYFCLDPFIYVLTTRSTTESGWNDRSSLEILIQEDAFPTPLRVTKHKLDTSSSTFSFSSAFEQLLESSLFTNGTSVPALWTDPLLLYNIHDPASDQFYYTSSSLYHHLDPYHDYEPTNPKWYSYLNSSTYYQPQTIYSSSPLWLFRSIYNITVPEACKAFEFYYKIRGGVFIYLDGMLLLRTNTQEEQLSIHSIATSGLPVSDPPEWRSFQGSCSLLTTGTHVFSIAVLPYGTYTTRKVDYEERLRLILDSDVNVLSLSMAITSTNGMESVPSSSLLLDRYYSTSLRLSATSTPGSTIAVHLQGVTMNSPNYFYLNRFCLVVSEPFFAQTYSNFTLSLYNEPQYQWHTVYSSTQLRLKSHVDKFCASLSLSTAIYNTNAFKIDFTVTAPFLNTFIASMAELEFYAVDSRNSTVPAQLYERNEYHFYVDVPFSIEPQTDVFASYAITPSLPLGLTFDPTRGFVEGTAHAPFTRTFQITATDITNAEFTYAVTLIVENCPSSSIFFSLEFQFFYEYSQKNRYELYARSSTSTPSLTLVDSIPSFSYYFDRYTRYYCLPQQDYVLVLYNRPSVGWNGTTVTLYLENRIPYLRNTLYYSESPKSILLSLHYRLSPSTTLWRYFMDPFYPGYDWFHTSYLDSHWLMDYPESFPQATTITQYYRTAFNITSFHSYSSFVLQFYLRSGVALYMNEQLIYHVHLPEGWNHTTYANECYDRTKLITLSFSLQSRLLHEGTNWLCAEIHQYASLPPDAFNVTLLFTYDDTYLAIQPQVRYQAPLLQPSMLAYNGIESLFDMNMRTSFHGWFCNHTQYISYLLPDASIVVYNTITLVRSSGPEESLPTSIRVEGSKDGSQWVPLFVEHNLTFGSYNKKSGLLTYPFYNLEGYSTYRFFLGSPQSCTHELALSDLLLSYREMRTYCSALGSYAPAVDGQWAYRDCYSYYDGYRKRLCQQGKWGPEITMCALSAPLTILYDSFTYEFIKKEPISMAMPLVQAAEYYLSVYPSLPKGVFFNSRTGQFYGTPQEEMKCTVYTVMTMNSQGSSKTFLTLCVNPNPQVGNSAFTVIILVLSCFMVAILLYLVYVNHWKKEKHRNFQLPRKIQQRKYIK